jgi:putative transposase
MDQFAHPVTAKGGRTSLTVQHFQTIEELRQALLAFRETYNATWLIERHGFMSPAVFRQRQLQPVAEAA